MSRHDAVKTKFLGMPVTTATRRLSRMLLFHLAQKLGLDVCVRCGRKIATLKSFSIEHKEVWLHVDAALFWDLENVGFSHRGCNSSVRRCPHKRYASVRERNRTRFSKYYADPKKREAWNSRRRARYAQGHPRVASTG